MFGYLKTYNPQLRLCELEAYKAVYCGLCRDLGKRFGLAARFTLSYDFTFLAMLDMSLRDEEPQIRQRRCAFNPLKKAPAAESCQSLSYACDMALLMLWHKLRDDVADGGFWKGMAARLALVLAGRGYREASQRHPELSAVMAGAMERQSALEKAGCQSLDEACQPTADILAAVLGRLACDEAQRRVLERLGLMLGRYVYLADALDDLEKDRASGNYNPFLLETGKSDEELRGAAVGSLYLTIAEAAKAYELLDVRRFGPVLDNILFLGLRAVADELRLPPARRKQGGTPVPASQG